MRIFLAIIYCFMNLAGCTDAQNRTILATTQENGVVTLEGTVEQRWIKHSVEDMAEACSGVKDIVNHLRVARAGEAARDRSGPT